MPERKPSATRPGNTYQQLSIQDAILGHYGTLTSSGNKHSTYLLLLTSSPNELKLFQSNVSTDTETLAVLLVNETVWDSLLPQTSPASLWQLYVIYLALSRPIQVHKAIDKCSILIELWR